MFSVMLRLVMSLVTAHRGSSKNVSGTIHLFVDPRLLQNTSGFTAVVGEVVKVQS